MRYPTMRWNRIIRMGATGALGMLLTALALASPPGHRHLKHKKGKVISSTEAQAAI